MLELGKGYQVAAVQDLAEGYEQTSETYLTANVGVKIQRGYPDYKR